MEHCIELRTLPNPLVAISGPAPKRGNEVQRDAEDRTDGDCRRISAIKLNSLKWSALPSASSTLA